MELKFVLLLIAVFVIILLCAFGVTPVARRIVKKTPTKLDDLLVETHVVSRTAYLLPLAVFSIGAREILDKSFWLYEYCNRTINVLFIIIAFGIACAVLDVFEHLNGNNPKTQAKPLHGIFQAVKLAFFCVGAILVSSQLSGKSPVLILSTLGAAATILMLLFRDSILGVVSGVQINMSDLLRKGDWIEIERHHTDGSVIDITLTSVKVRNWDNSISVIPAYDLITNSFRNWRGMQESGGRRIKRSLYIDMHSVRFLTENEIENLSKIDILKPYLEQKKQDIANENKAHKIILEKSTTPAADQECCGCTMLNTRHLTNIGTFRAYCTAYLRSRKKIEQKMTLMTRQLPPTPTGLPLEVYAFANDTKWENYEEIQADIFDHLIAALPEFGLSLFQYAGYPQNGK